MRYGDDFVVVAGDWLQVNRALEQITQWLADIYLTLQPEKTQIFAPNQGFTFLGYRFEAGRVTAPPPVVTVKPGTTLESGMVSRREVGKPIKLASRPPTDPINSMLSLGYTLLFQNIHSLVQAVGLHTHFGNLHVPRQNHPALVSDLVEEFRAPIVDSTVMYLANSQIFIPEDFTPPDERGGVYLYPDSLKKFLKHWQERLQTRVTHGHTGYKVNYHRCLELQVWEYVACLMGEQEVYRPMPYKM